MCKALCVSRSGYYNWVDRPKSNRQRYNESLIEQIKNIHCESRGVYGAIKTWKTLNQQGFACGLNKVRRLRQSIGIIAQRMKRFRLIQQGRRTHSVPAKNIIAQDFQADKLNQKWVCDTTFIPTRKGWLYLATVIDLYSRKVVGWSMSKKNDKKLVIDALQMAINRRKPKKGLLCHSDQGVQYASGDYKSILAKYKIIQSMSRKGCCWDNAVAESFFNNIKNEMVFNSKYNCQNEARAAIFDYIEIFYNRQRIHQSLDYKTPNEFEKLNFVA